MRCPNSCGRIPNSAYIWSSHTMRSAPTLPLPAAQAGRADDAVEPGHGVVQAVIGPAELHLGHGRFGQFAETRHVAGAEDPGLGVVHAQGADDRTAGRSQGDATVRRDGAAGHRRQAGHSRIPPGIGDDEGLAEDRRDGAQRLLQRARRTDLAAGDAHDRLLVTQHRDLRRGGSHRSAASRVRRSRTSDVGRSSSTKESTTRTRPDPAAGRSRPGKELPWAETCRRHVQRSPLHSILTHGPGPGNLARRRSSQLPRPGDVAGEPVRLDSR